MTNKLQKIISSSKRAHAYLLTGYEGDKKRGLIREFAQALLCKTRNACGECHSCHLLKNENHPDYFFVSPQKGSLKIDKIREILERLVFKPIEGDQVVVHLVEADQMTEGAANALLKTLEEPPSYVIFLISTALPEKLSSTIRSRCQTIFLPEDPQEITAAWKNFLPSWREKILPSLGQGNPHAFSKASQLAEESLKLWDDLNSFFHFLLVWWRDLAVSATLGQSGELRIASWEELQPLLKHRTDDRIFHEIDCILETQRAMEGHVLKQLAMERLFLNLL